MRLARLVLGVSAVLLLTSLAWAGPQMILDPQISGPPGFCPDPTNNNTPVLAIDVTLPFNFQVQAGKFFYCFMNEDKNNVLWPDLTVTLPKDTFLFGDIQCGTDLHFFSQCTVIPDPQNDQFASAFFWSGPPPIGFGAPFGFDIRPPNGQPCTLPDGSPNPDCFPVGTSFTADSSVDVPEPMTLVLVLTGGAALIRRRRKLA